MFTQIFPIIATPDLARALSFYRDLLGATVAFEFRGPDGEPGYVGLDLGSSHLGIGRDESLTQGSSERFSLWVYAEDVDAAVALLREAGVTIEEEPVDQPWGERTARVLDPDGNLVHLASR
ncbi:MAG TPA: glyoxalase superfamily protein [Candidatus Limnocylindria bacterium]|nr:glyoxalase superfamily protein [Candidatus Limnocylindria bacterium]